MSRGALDDDAVGAAVVRRRRARRVGRATRRACMDGNKKKGRAKLSVVDSVGEVGMSGF